MSLSEDERRELERLRKYYRQSKAEKKSQETWMEAIMLRGLFPGIAFVCISYYFKLDTLFGGNITLFGAFICITLGTLSAYYGPLKKKKEEEDEELEVAEKIRRIEEKHVKDRIDKLTARKEEAES